MGRSSRPSRVVGASEMAGEKGSRYGLVKRTFRFFEMGGLLLVGMRKDWLEWGWEGTVDVDGGGGWSIITLISHLFTHKHDRIETHGRYASGRG